MTPENDGLVQQSWSLVSQRGMALSERFYARLFELAPEQQRLFTLTDMQNQQRKFIAMLQEIVQQIGNPGRLVPGVAALGARHVRYGVTPEGYTVVGEALLWALEQELGSALTPQLREAWKEAYLLVAKLMQRGAELGDSGTAGRLT